MLSSHTHSSALQVPWVRQVMTGVEGRRACCLLEGSAGNSRDGHIIAAVKPHGHPGPTKRAAI